MFNWQRIGRDWVKRRYPTDEVVTVLVGTGIVGCHGRLRGAMGGVAMVFTNQRFVAFVSWPTKALFGLVIGGLALAVLVLFSATDIVVAGLVLVLSVALWCWLAWNAVEIRRMGGLVLGALVLVTATAIAITPDIVLASLVLMPSLALWSWLAWKPVEIPRSDVRQVTWQTEGYPGTIVYLELSDGSTATLFANTVAPESLQLLAQWCRSAPVTARPSLPAGARTQHVDVTDQPELVAQADQVPELRGEFVQLGFRPIGFLDMRIAGEGEKAHVSEVLASPDETAFVGLYLIPARLAWLVRRRATGPVPVAELDTALEDGTIVSTDSVKHWLSRHHPRAGYYFKCSEEAPAALWTAHQHHVEEVRLTCGSAVLRHDAMPLKIQIADRTSELTHVHVRFLSYGLRGLIGLFAFTMVSLTIYFSFVPGAPRLTFQEGRSAAAAVIVVFLVLIALWILRLGLWLPRQLPWPRRRPWLPE